MGIGGSGTSLAFVRRSDDPASPWVRACRLSRSTSAGPTVHMSDSAEAMCQMMRALLPSWEHAAVAVGESLRPEPAPVLAVVGAEHRFHSEEARRCARAAAELLGIPLTSLPNREDGAPLWPEGCTGSLAHTSSYCVAIVSTASCIRSVGVDVEWARPFSEHMTKLVVREDDTVLDDARQELGREQAPTVVFSAKEAVYKAIAQLRPGWIDFQDCRLEATLSHQFRAHVDLGGRHRELAGAWRTVSHGGRRAVLSVVVENS